MQQLASRHSGCLSLRLLSAVLWAACCQQGSTPPLADARPPPGALQGRHNATILALVKLSAPDTPVLLLAFSAGAAAALGQALIPYYTGAPSA